MHKRFMIVSCLLFLVLSSCSTAKLTPEEVVLTLTPTATTTATPQPSPTTVPLLFGGYSADRLSSKGILGPDVNLTSIDGKISITIPLEGLDEKNDLSYVSLSWSPDGKWLATGFIDDCEEGCGIHIIDINNRVDHLVIPENGYNLPDRYNYGYSWNASSDSVITSIPALHEDQFGNKSIVQIGLEDFSIIVTGNTGYMPMYSPTGNDYAFMQSFWPNHYYYVVKAGTTDPTLVATAAIGNPFISDAMYLWSRDGKSLIYATTKEILSVDVDTTVKRVILKMNTYYDLRQELLSHDGKYLAFYYGPLTARINPGFINLETGKYVMLPEIGNLFWTKDNQLLFYSYSEGDTSTPCSVDLATGDLTPIDVPEWVGYSIQP